MATTTFPNTAGVKRGRWLVGGVVLIISMIIAALVINGLSRRSAAQVPVTTAVASGTIVASVAGSGTIAAVQSLELPFKTNGTVTEVLVTEGDTVATGQPLARLDERDLQLQVENAQASLASAQARLNQTKEGNATPEDIAAAKASVANAQANLSKTRTGSVTAADIASAEASLRSAQAKLDALKNPSPDKISSAQLQVTQAQNALQSTRNSASATKTKAELDLKKAVETLVQAQSSYGTALEEWKHVQDTGTDPINPTTTNAQGGATDNKVNGAQAQQYYDSYVRAESSMRSAEQAVTQAQVTYDNARQQEVVDVQDAEAKLADAQQQLDALKSPSQSDVVQAQAAVDQAAANVKKSKQGGTAAEVAAAQANVAQNQANLDKLTAPATATDIEIQQAAVAQAEQSLKQAQLNLEQATLTAPFNGIITDVLLRFATNIPFPERQPPPFSPLIPIVILVMFFSALIILVRLGRPTISALLVIGAWTLITSLNALQSGVNSYTPALLIIPICVAGLLIDWVACVSLAALAAVLVGSLAWIERLKLMPTPHVPLPAFFAENQLYFAVAFWVGLFATVAALTSLLAGGLQRALQQSHAHALALEDLSSQLEARVEMQTTKLLDQERESATLAERTRLAREIHDTLAQGLTGIVLQLGAAQRALGVESNAADEHIDLAQRMAREALAEARRSVWNLRAPALERGSLADALRSLVARPIRNEIVATFEERGEPWPLSVDAEGALLRAAQEALANVAKHTQATRVEVVLAYEPDLVQLCISDNGQGFEPTLLREGATPHPLGGFGLLGMRERIGALGGTLELANNGGARVVVTLIR